MANVNLRVSVKVRDGDGEETSFPLYRTLADTTTLASLATEVSTLVTLLQPLCDGSIIGVDTALVSDASDQAAELGSEIERTGLFTFSLTGQERTYSIDIPAISLDILTGNTIAINNSDVSALENHLTLNGYTDPMHNALDTLLKARKTFRKHRKSTSRV